MVADLVDRIDFFGHPKGIPRNVRKTLKGLLDSITRSTNPQEIKHTIDLFRLMTDPVTHGYDKSKSNEQIQLLNRRLGDMGYGSQVPEY